MAIKRNHLHIPTINKTDDTTNLAQFAGAPYAKSLHTSSNINFLPHHRANYMARDYDSFRQLLLDRLAIVLPTDKERNPADFDVMMEEIFAYTGDYLSYFQDSVGTESYLNTARNRISIKRHLSLINYHLHEGYNARVWANFEVKNQTSIVSGTPLISRIDHTAPSIHPEEHNIGLLIQQNNAACFETMHDKHLFPDQNIMNFYDWGLPDYTIPAGATGAILNGHVLSLKPGDIIILTQLPSNFNTHGHYTTKDALACQAIRLVDVYKTTKAVPFFPTDDIPQAAFELADDIKQQAITCIRWHEEDALSFDLSITNREVPITARAFGNVVLADQGFTQEHPVDFNTHYTPQIGELDLSDLIYAERPSLAQQYSANALEQQVPHKALPSIVLSNNLNEWHPVHNLLECGRFDRAFVVERQDDGMGYLRFGDDEYGQSPTKSPSTIRYRVATGLRKKMGAHVLQHIVSNNESITHVSNLISSTTPLEPESAQQACIMAPKAYQKLETCIKPENYNARALETIDVVNAVTQPIQDGRGKIMCIYIQQAANFPLYKTQAKKILQSIQPYASITHRVTVHPARYVPVKLCFVIHMKNGASLPYAQESLSISFGQSSSTNSDAFFADKNLSFGAPLILSDIIQKISTIAGVDYIDTQDPRTSFQRLDDVNSHDRLKDGIIPVQPHEIIMMLNNPETPNDGQITFILEQKNIETSSNIHNAEGIL